MLLVLAIAMDQLTKDLATEVFVVVKNQGLLLNTFENLPSNIKVISLATGAGVLFFFYMTLLFLINQKMKFPRYALSLIMGGIFSNTLDKIIFGYTKDFIPFWSYAFNFADILTMGGTIFLLIYIIKNQHEIWITNESRRNILVNPHAQVMFGLKYSIVSLCTSILMGVFAFTFIKNQILPEILVSSNNFMSTFMVLYFTLTLLFSSIVFVIGVIVSHRFVGPIVALERFVEGLNQGNDVSLSRRQGDYFKHLEELSVKIKEIKTRI